MNLAEDDRNREKNEENYQSKRRTKHDKNIAKEL